VIVVIGNPIGTRESSARRIAGPGADVAIAAARAGSRVELVGRVGDDPTGDAAVLALGQAGVGHAALLRDPARPTPVVVEIEAAVPGSDPNPDGDDQPRAFEPPDRDRWPALEAEDVELALRYLPDVRTIVVAEAVGDAILGVAGQSARYFGARLIVIADDQGAAPDADLVLAPPDDDRDGAFAGLVGELAAALDRGQAVDDAFDTVKATLGVSRAES
jgi:hypothetical protein